MGTDRSAALVGEVMGHYSSFVVKIWVDSGGGMSRGQIQHVATRETAHFLTIEKMAEFMVSHLEAGQNECDALLEDAMLNLGPRETD
jgi:hypothetical protein